MNERDIIRNLIDIGKGKAKDLLIEKLRSMKFNDEIRNEDQPSQEEADQLSEKEIKRITKLIEDGFISKAGLMVEKETTGVAQVTKEIIQQLKILNPDKNIK